MFHYGTSYSKCTQVTLYFPLLTYTLRTSGPTLPKPVPAVPKVENAHSAAETSSAQAILAPEAPLFPLPGTTGGKKVKGKKKAGAEDADLSLATCASGTAMPAHLNDLWTECIRGKGTPDERFFYAPTQKKPGCEISVWYAFGSDC